MATAELILDQEQGLSVRNADLMEVTRNEISMHVNAARKHPRSIKEFRRQVIEMACLNEDIAASMYYVLPRAGKNIEGPSARFAEICGASYRNLRYVGRILGTDGDFVIAEGACWDSEKNVCASIQVRRRITDSSNKRFSTDMIQVTGAAACSIAIRNSIFKVVPFVLVSDILEEAKKTAVGKAESVADRKQKMLEWFDRFGVKQERILESIGRTGVEDVTLDDLAMLRGLATALKEGEITVESAFEAPLQKRGVQRSSLPDEITGEPKAKPRANPKRKAKAKPKAKAVSESAPQPDPLKDPDQDAPKESGTEGGTEGGTDAGTDANGPPASNFQHFSDRLNVSKLGILQSLREPIASDETLLDDERQTLLETLDERVAILMEELDA